MNNYCLSRVNLMLVCAHTQSFLPKWTKEGLQQSYGLQQQIAAANLGTENLHLEALRHSEVVSYGILKGLHKLFTSFMKTADGMIISSKIKKEHTISEARKTLVTL